MHCSVYPTVSFPIKLQASQNGAFHFKLFSDFIFWSPFHDIKLITACLTCTLFSALSACASFTFPHYAVQTLWDVGSDFPLKYVLLHNFETCISQATSVMKSISNRVMHALCSVISDKQKSFLIWILTPSSWYAFMKSKRVWLLVTVNISLLPINRPRKGNSDLSAAILPVRDV